MTYNEERIHNLVVSGFLVNFILVCLLSTFTDLIFDTCLVISISSTLLLVLTRELKFNKGEKLYALREKLTDLENDWERSGVSLCGYYERRIVLLMNPIPNNDDWAVQRKYVSELHKLDFSIDLATEFEDRQRKTYT